MEKVITKIKQKTKSNYLEKPGEALKFDKGKFEDMIERYKTYLKRSGKTGDETSEDEQQ